MPSSSTILPPPNAEVEKVNSSSGQRSRSRKRGIIFVFLALALVFFYLSPSTTTSSIWAKLKSFAGCGSSTMSSSHHSQHTTTTTASAEGWHARATRAPTSPFAPKKADLVFTALVNSQMEPEGFTMALLRPNHAVDASGHVLTLTSHDFAAFEAQVRAVHEHVPLTGAFMGQWRVKQARTSYPIDRVLIPGEEEESRAVYGWTKSDHELELEEETKGRTTLPKELQVLVGWAKEAREGYVRGQFDEAVVSKVRALLE